MYRLADERFLVVANAGNAGVVSDALAERLTGFRAVLDDRSLATGLLAVQGPASAGLLAPLTDVDLGALRYYAAAEGTVAGIPGLVARTGYTGEDGFEVFVDTAQTVPLWDALLAAVATSGGLPIGLGARDTLRLEAGMPLYGNELDLGTDPYQAGLGRVVKLGKTGDFVGRTALEKIARDGPSRRLVGLIVEGRGIARHGYPVWSGERRTGVVTSGTQSPDARRADRDGVRRTRRRRAGYRSRYRDPRCAGAGTGRDPAVLQEGWLSAMVPTDLHYTKDHEWVRVEGDQATIGITAYAADQLGDIVFVELPDAGRALEQFAAFGVVESVKAVSDLFAPVSGEVNEANGELGANPELVNSDPYGGGWMIQVAPHRPGQLDGLLDATPTTRSSRPADPADAVRTPHRRRPRADARGARPDIDRPALRGHPGRAARVRRSTCPSPSPSSSWPPGSAASPRGTGPTSPRSSAPASTGTGARPRSTSSCCAASGTRPTRRTSPRSARARSRASTSTSRCWPSWSTSTSCPRRTTTARRPRPRPR